MKTRNKGTLRLIIRIAPYINPKPFEDFIAKTLKGAERSEPTDDEKEVFFLNPDCPDFKWNYYQFKGKLSFRNTLYAVGMILDQKPLDEEYTEYREIQWYLMKCINGIDNEILAADKETTLQTRSAAIEAGLI